MRKYIIMSLLLLLCCIGAITQSIFNGDEVGTPTPLPSGNSWEAKHFREALTNGRPTKSYYVLVNDEKKVVKVQSLIEFCEKHDYLYKEEYETKGVAKFGDVATTVSKFYFIPRQEFIYYVFDWTNRTAVRADELQKRGSGYFFDAESYSFIQVKNNILWSGSIVDGMIDGNGTGIYQISPSKFYYFSGVFKRGFPVGKATYRVINTDNNTAWGYSPREKLPSGHTGNGAPFRQVEVGDMSEGLATFRYLDTGESRNNGNELYGFVDQYGNIVIKPKYKSASAFHNGRASVPNEQGEDIYIDKTGQFVDYTPRQKQIFAAAKAREDSINLEKERARLLAEQKAAEERRIAEEKEADLQRRIEANKNTKLWTRGCRLCYRYPNGNEYVIATLEEWNNDHSRVKVKIVASPSATRTLNGDLLEKNNTMWVSARNEGWHLALDEEITAALNNDNSMKRSEPTYTPSSSYSSSYSDCSTCHGAGKVECSLCNGTGRRDTSGWGEDANYESCSYCHGSGRITCSSCRGTGRR